MRHKDLYRKTLGEGRVKVDVLSRKLKNHIFKSQPFVDMWRKAKEVWWVEKRVWSCFKTSLSLVTMTSGPGYVVCFTSVNYNLLLF